MDYLIYYHFLSSEHAICDLKNERIKVSTFSNLNDIFELRPYRRYELSERQLYDKVYRENCHKWGLLCFSKSYQEPLLWAHYADRHKGIALGFEILKDEIIKVKYTSDEIRTQIDLTNDPIENEKRNLSLFKEKHKDWEYENEYRVLVKLEECDSENGLYFIKFGERLKIKEIVLGCRFDHKKEQENIFNLAKKLRAKVIATRPGWGDYKIHKDGRKTPKYQY